MLLPPDLPTIYRLLLSFAGKSLEWQEFETRKRDVNALGKALLRRGISHQNLSPNHVLWDEAALKLMVVNFERSTTAAVCREALQELSSNRKRKQSAQEDKVTANLVG